MTECETVDGSERGLQRAATTRAGVEQRDETQSATGAREDVQPKDNLCDSVSSRTVSVGSGNSVGGPAHQKAARLKQHNGESNLHTLASTMISGRFMRTAF